MTSQALEAGGPVLPARKKMRHRPPAYQPEKPYPLTLPIPLFRAVVEAEIGPLGPDEFFERLARMRVLQVVKLPGTKYRLVLVEPGLATLRQMVEEAAAAQNPPRAPTPDTPTA